MNILKNISNNDLEKIYNYFIKNNYQESELYNIIQNIYINKNYDFTNENQKLVQLIEKTYKYLLQNNEKLNISKSDIEKVNYDSEWIIVNLDS